MMKKIAAGPDFHPSLQGAYARVRRARKHLTWLKREVARFWKNEGIEPVGPPESIRSLAFIQYASNRVPLDWGVVIGECIYNIQTALDYLVFELAVLDSGREQKGTQFPIEETERGWHGKVKAGYLKGLSSNHKIVIEGLQPWSGCDWTRRIKSISNPDKHRALTMMHVTKLAINPVFSPETEVTSITPAVAESYDEPLKVYAYIAFEPALVDGAPFIIELEELLEKVRELLDTFNGEFREFLLEKV